MSECQDDALFQGSEVEQSRESEEPSERCPFFLLAALSLKLGHALTFDVAESLRDVARTVDKFLTNDCNTARKSQPYNPRYTQSALFSTELAEIELGGQDRERHRLIGICVQV